MRRDRWSLPELESIPFHSPVECATTQTQGLGGLAHVAVEALQGLTHQDAFDFLDAEFFQILALRTLQDSGRDRETWISSVWHIRTARSSVCSSSRTLPGQAYCIIACMAGAAKPLTCTR